MEVDLMRKKKKKKKECYKFLNFCFRILIR